MITESLDGASRVPYNERVPGKNPGTERKTDMKKYGILLTALLLALSLALPCLAEEVPAPEAPAFDWARDAKEHWHELENGEKADVEAHALTEEGRCEVCGCEFLDYGEDGWIEVYDSNEYDDLVRVSFYFADGTLDYECTYAYGYDENGVMLWEYRFVDGELVDEVIYTVDEDGLQHLAYTIGHDADGGWTRCDYDENDNAVKTCAYDAEGELYYEENCEYAMNDEGWFYLVKQTTYTDGQVFINEYNEYEDWLRAAVMEEDGTLLSELTFDYVYEDGVKVSYKQYEDGTLTGEMFLDENGNVIREIEYLADGTTNEYTYEYDEDGNWIE